MTETAENINILDIRCPSCGAPAHYDIIHQQYLCGFCGSEITVKDANLQFHGFRKIRSRALQDSLDEFHLSTALCKGCGASVVFEESEALSQCAFCGSSLVRKDYLNSEDMPESVIPFAITKQEAEKLMADWCDQNRSRKEAKHLRKVTGRLQGFYLPYEMVRGPVSMEVSRMDGIRKYSCEGFMNSEFINRSEQLDNLLLNGMEPYDLNALKEFDFSYLAGHCVRIADLDEASLVRRMKQETAVSYTPYIRKTLQTKAVNISPDLSDAVRLPVLLPAYYVSDGKLRAAVNGQTGKVSVKAENQSYYYFLPWWFKAILATLAVCVLFSAAAILLGMSVRDALSITAMLGIVMIIVMLCLFSDYSDTTFAAEAGFEIFTSGNRTFHRERGGLVMDDEILESRVEKPVFFQNIDGRSVPCQLRFAVPWRLLRMILLTLGILFLPVIIALLLNGFDFSRLELGGSAVWFCIMVPVLPVYLIRFGLLNLYEKPEIDLIQQDGSKKKYREPSETQSKDTGKIVMNLLFVPPMCFVTWLCIAVFFAMCWWTAFGF